MYKEEKINNLNKKIVEKYWDDEIVLGHGNVNSSLILIGEAPGSNEVKLKKPFVGQAGKQFDEFLEVLEVNREDIYITNAVKYRPTKKSKKTEGVVNRPPTTKEIDCFKEYLFEEIDIIKPKIIATLGNSPLKALFDSSYKIGEIHGKVFNKCINGKDYKVYPLYHPAAILYRRQLKEVYLKDLMGLKKLL